MDFYRAIQASCYSFQVVRTVPASQVVHHSLPTTVIRTAAQPTTTLVRQPTLATVTAGSNAGQIFRIAGTNQLVRLAH